MIEGPGENLEEEGTSFPGLCVYFASSCSCSIGLACGTAGGAHPSDFHWHPRKQLHGKFCRCPSHGAQGQALHGRTGFPMSSAASPVGSTLVTFWRVQPVPLPACYKFDSTPKGSFPISLAPSDQFSSHHLVLLAPCGGISSFSALAHSSWPWLLACFRNQLWLRATWPISLPPSELQPHSLQ